MTADPMPARRWTARLVLTASTAGLLALTACSGGSSPAPSTPAASPSGPAPTTTGSAGPGSATSGSATTGSATTTGPAGPTAATSSTPGNPRPSIVGAPTLAALIAAGTAAVHPIRNNLRSTAFDGTVTTGGFSMPVIDNTYKGQVSYNIAYNPADKSITDVQCLSPAPVGTVDAVLKLCTDLHYAGSDPASAEAWVEQAMRRIPAKDSTSRQVDPALNGLHWVVYRAAVNTDDFTVLVSTTALSP